MGSVRIIGGAHRGRRLPFVDAPGLRPTGDRMRETLFNWLQPVIVGAHCLDVFAGSGALGLEAASRGASQVVMIDIAKRVVQQLQENVRVLGLPQVNILHADAIKWLRMPTGSFDVVFLDPPFNSNLVTIACSLLLEHNCLNPGAIIYLELDFKTSPPSLPAGLTIIRQQRMGQVWCALVSYGNSIYRGTATNL